MLVIIGSTTLLRTLEMMQYHKNRVHVTMDFFFWENFCITLLNVVKATVNMFAFCHILLSTVLNYIISDGLSTPYGRSKNSSSVCLNLQQLECEFSCFCCSLKGVFELKVTWKLDTTQTSCSVSAKKNKSCRLIICLSSWYLDSHTLVYSCY